MISLPNRLENCKIIASKLGIKEDVWILEAIDKNKLDMDEISEFISSKFLIEKNLGRFACHFSHLACLIHFLEDDSVKNCVIFEARNSCHFKTE